MTDAERMANAALVSGELMGMVRERESVIAQQAAQIEHLTETVTQQGERLAEMAAELDLLRAPQGEETA